MRLSLNEANAYLIYLLQGALNVDRIFHNGFDIVWVDLVGGERVAIHLIERDIDVGMIKDILRENSSAGRYTLFILWCAMLLPDHGDLYPPYDWMTALTELYGDLIYAYETDGPRVWFFPVHFEPQGRGTERRIRYGETLDMERMRCDVIHMEGSFVNGRWHLASFEGVVANRPAQEPEPPTIRIHASLRVHYDVLGVAYDADFETIKRAYRTLAMRYHPDLNRSPEAHGQMQRINSAYAKIADLFGE